MTVKELIKTLESMPPDLEIYAVHGASGSSYEVGGSNVETKSELDEIGPVCELSNGTQYVSMYIGN